ncbi:MAG: MFS transporter [Candidatus Lokiarchaeota archaeon]|nr:MFS transporter [Candidatus Lokiarchaeota archaeon]
MTEKEALPGRDPSNLSKLDDPKKIWSWVLYDWGNSAFATTVMAGFFPTFLNAFWVGESTAIDATVILGFGNSISAILVAAMSPFLGAVADKMSGKKRFLLFFAALGILTTGCLWLVQAGNWLTAILLYVLGTIGFSGGNSFYDSLLPGVASQKKIDYVSSLGFAIGYIGGGVLFALNVIMYLMWDTFGFANESAAVSFAFLSVAIWWAGFSIPVFLFVDEPKIDKEATFRKSIKLGWKQLKGTFAEIRYLKIVGLFLIGYWFYIDGVDTIIKMAVDYAESLGFDSTWSIVALLVTQFVAFPMTLLYNKFAKKIGVKKGILVAIVGYGCITIAGYFMGNEIHFLILAVCIGCFQGGIQALSRSLYSRIIPVEKSGEFYGFYNMLGKFAAILGPALMGLVAIFNPDPRASILPLLILFLIGGIILYKVDLEEGERMAKEYLSKNPLDDQDENATDNNLENQENLDD